MFLSFRNQKALILEGNKMADHTLLVGLSFNTQNLINLKWKISFYLFPRCSALPDIRLPVHGEQLPDQSDLAGGE